MLKSLDKKLGCCGLYKNIAICNNEQKNNNIYSHLSIFMDNGVILGRQRPPQ